MMIGNRTIGMKINKFFFIAGLLFPIVAVTQPGKLELNIDDLRLKICGIASGFAFGYDPTGRSVFSI
jgi:hypothetical protein